MSQENILDYKNQPKLTRIAALKEIEEIRDHNTKGELSLDTEQKKLLTDLENYLTR